MSQGVETSFTPEDFAEFSETMDENVVLGVNIGMEIEARSRNFYQSVAKKLPPDRRFILMFLANEELDHLKILIAFKTALQKNDSWIELSQKQLRRMRVPRLYEGKGTVPFIKEDARDVDIILAAMRAEKRTEQFYKRIGEKISDSRAKSFFDVIARFERGHYNLLKGVLQTSLT